MHIALPTFPTLPLAQLADVTRRRLLGLGAALALPGCAWQSSLQDAPPVTLPGTRQLDLRAPGMPGPGAPERVHRIMVAVPPAPPPPQGYPVLYLLDGNLLFTPTAQLMRNRFARGPSVPTQGAVVVGLGYADSAVLDLSARSYDYTPPAPGPATDERGRAEGGADHFLDFIDQQVRPLVEASWPIDRARQTFFGHSYGGLCVLHALLTRPGGFQRYVAASPSIWWRDGFVLQALPGFVDHAARQPADAPALQLLLTQGEREARPAKQTTAPAPSSDPARDAIRRQRQNAPGIPALMEGLRGAPGLALRYASFPGADHGSAMLPAAQQALAMAIED
ncbi:alpha/beta hydrolase [Comamonas koreensis]|uniref:Prolyl oligopeptidase family serine peptidase n=1 Tax=Comamonas koreensis TaxID=160825 RepID=A0AAW4XUC5_9BURK|nr:alpha/beta hydrolase-fold protein [Comamonas koreensis]MCD2165125.1 prolyl oligopeptidase family serine peptidase [Comamonas koreensis]